MVRESSESGSWSLAPVGSLRDVGSGSDWVSCMLACQGTLIGGDRLCNIDNKAGSKIYEKNVDKR